MKTLIIVGTGEVCNMGEIIRELSAEGHRVGDVLMYNYIDDIPADYRTGENVIIKEIHTIKAPPILKVDPKILYPEKKKGHERPYKYHR